MKLNPELNFKKRKRLERDYGEYSKDNIPHTLKGEYAIKYARNFHDRAITCVDLANIYWLCGINDAALIYMESGIDDLKKAIDIYTKLQNKQPEIEKCALYIRVFKQNVQTIKCKIKQAEVSEQGPKLKEAPYSPIRESIFRTPRCTPIKSKGINCKTSSIEKSAPIDDGKPVRVLNFH